MQNQSKSYFMNSTFFVNEEGSSNRTSVQVNSHVCGECNSSFVQFEHCALHVQKKIKEQFYQCSVCLLCFSDNDLCNEHNKTCKLQKYNCAECGIALSTDCESFICEPLLLYNLVDIVPDVISETIFKKSRLFFTVKKYPIHKTDSHIGKSSTETINPVTATVSSAIPKNCTSLNIVHSSESDELVSIDLNSEMHTIKTLRQRISQLKVQLYGGFFDSEDVFSRALLKRKVSDVCVTKSSGNCLNKKLSLKDIFVEERDNTVSFHHCKNVRDTSVLATSKSDDRIPVLNNGISLLVKMNKIASCHKNVEIKQLNDYAKSFQQKEHNAPKTPILCKLDAARDNSINEQSSTKSNKSYDSDISHFDLKGFFLNNSKQENLVVEKEDICQKLNCNEKQFCNIVDSRRDPVSNQTQNNNDAKLLYTDIEQSNSLIHGTTKCSISNQMSILKSKGISASRINEKHLRIGEICNINNNLRKEATVEEIWEKLKNVYNLKKCSVALHKLPSQVFNVSTSPIKNDFKSENEIKDLSVNLFRLPNYVQDYQSYKIYCQSHAHKTFLHKKQKKKSKGITNFIYNNLPSSAPEDGDMSSVAECETSVCIKSSNHVKMSSSNNGENSHESLMQDSFHQISEIVPESSPPIFDDYELSDDSEQHFEFQSPSTSECSKTSDDGKYPSLSKKTVEQQFDDIVYQPRIKEYEPPHLVPYYLDEIMPVASDALIDNHNSNSLFESVDKNRTNVPNSLKSSKPFVLWKTDEQLKYLKDRIKCINKVLEE
ncbi:hypothetical protein TNCT_398061 [Trichonephila clavata]|uniref:C2H2-type domain-containing protein n=1 Tax=Trichonephila clavata TaxID=2740835 RepID=A0A8X6FWK2_TRICU|nr:hypothetical protein TNCT_398061 [Trichonephila clavata]